MKHATRFTQTLLAAAVASSFSGVAVAQDSGSSASSTGSVSLMIEEVQVTARRKDNAEALQDVPVAVSAFSGDQLEAMFAANVQDITANVPNAQAWEASAFPGYVNFYVRGVGVSGTVVSDDPAVGVFVDGVYMGVSAGIITDSFDMESVEILRGPQGTLFGRNVTGGAALINTRKPTEEFEGRVRAIVGNEGRAEVAASVSGPLVDGKLLGKVAYFHKELDDYWNNIGGGDDMGEQEQDVIRGALTWLPTDSLSATLALEYGEADNDATPLYAYENEGFRTLSALAGAATLNEFLTNLADPSIIQAPVPDDGDDDISGNVGDPPSTEWTSANLTVDFDIGNGVLKSISAYREFEQKDLTNDFDGTSELYFDVDDTLIDQDQFSQEFVYNITLADRYNVTTGAYYFDQSYDYQEHRELNPWGPVALAGDTPDYLGGNIPGAVWADLTGPNGPLVGFYDWYTDSTTDHTVYGIFLQTDIAVTEKWNVTLGGRYSYEEKDVEINQFLATGCGGNPTDSLKTCAASPDTFKDDEDWDNFTPKVGAQYFLNDTTQFYASWSRGFRSGGFNVRQTVGTGPGPYDEETVDAYELGVKSDFADGRVRLNAAVFYNDYDDLQTTVLGDNGTQSVSNQGGAEMSGVELEGHWLIFDNLLLQANFGYIDTELKDTEDPATEGKEIKFVPEYQGGAALTYDIPLSFGALTFRGSYSYTDEAPSDDAHEGPFSESYELVDASISLSSESGWRVTAFGRNLLDEVEGGQITYAPGLATLGTQPAQPLNYGLELSYEF